MSPAARGLGVLALYVCGVFVVGAMLAYPVDAGLRMAGLFDGDFHRLTYRLLEALALLGLVPLLGVLGGGGRAAWGFGPGRGGSRAARELGLGFLVGVATLALVVLVLIALGVRSPKPQAPPLHLLVLKGVIVASMVSVLEESWFRGALHTALERLGGPVVAVVATASLYAVLHFYRPAALPPEITPGWASGLQVVGAGFPRLADPAILGPALALALGGGILGMLRVRTGRIAAAIGMHAGWVVAIRVGKPATEPRYESPWAWTAEGYDGVVGWVAVAAFVLVATVLCARRPGASRG